MCGKLLGKKEILSKTTSIFTKNVTPRQELLTVSTGKNQPPGFSVSGKLASNGLI